MKTLLVCLLIIISSRQYGWTQTYFPFPTTNATWGVVNHWWTMDPFNPVIVTQNYYVLAGDSEITNLSYVRLKTYLQGAWPDTIGFLREDSSKQIFFRQANTGFEYLNYDFSVVIGDTVLVPFGEFSNQMSLVVTSIDSVLVASYFRKKIVLEEYGQGYALGPHEWIEGIGSISHGLLYPELSWVDESANLYCFSYDSGYYLNPCPINLFIYNQYEDDVEVNLFPNPASQFIKLPCVSTDAVLIMNMLGQEVYSLEQVSNVCELKINVSELPEGIYQVFMQGKKNYFGRFIKGNH